MCLRDEKGEFVVVKTSWFLGLANPRGAEAWDIEEPMSSLYIA